MLRPTRVHGIETYAVGLNQAIELWRSFAEMIGPDVILYHHIRAQYRYALGKLLTDLLNDGQRWECCRATKEMGKHQGKGYLLQHSILPWACCENTYLTIYINCHIIEIDSIIGRLIHNNIDKDFLFFIKTTLYPEHTP